MKYLPTLLLSAIIALSGAEISLAAGGHAEAEPAETSHVETKAEDDKNHGANVTRLLMPIMSSSRGMELFVSTGCVACHSVNGVGGHDATSLDAHDMDEYMNPFDLAAKMWQMAPMMIAAQEEAFGEQIYFSGDELADIIAFLHDDSQQHKFSENDLTPAALKMMDHGHGVQTAVEQHVEETGHVEEPVHDNGDGHHD